MTVPKVTVVDVQNSSFIRWKLLEDLDCERLFSGDEAYIFEQKRSRRRLLDFVSQPSKEALTGRHPHGLPFHSQTKSLHEQNFKRRKFSCGLPQNRLQGWASMIADFDAGLSLLGTTVGCVVRAPKCLRFSCRRRGSALFGIPGIQAAEVFRQRLHGISSCISNVHVVDSKHHADSSGHFMLDVYFEGLEFLTKLNVSWEYVILMQV